MKRTLRAVSVAALTGVLSAPALAASVEALVKAGKYQEAYQQGLAQQEAREGTPSFDSAFATAALRSGHPGEAMFAFDRMLVMNPNNVGARLGLAEAMIALKNHKGAQAELMVAGKMRLTPAQRHRLGELQARAEAPADSGDSKALWVGFDVGHDSNVNEGTFHGTALAQGPFGAVVLGPSATEQQAYFNNYSLGGYYVHQLSDGRALDVVGRIDQRENLGEEDFDTRHYRLNSGYSVTHKGELYRVAIRLEQDDLDSERYRTVWGIIGEHSFSGGYSWNRGWEHKLVTGMARIDYQQNETALRDVDQFLIGLHGKKTMGDIAHSLRGYFIYESAEDEFPSSAGINPGKPAHHNGRRLYTLGWRGEFLNAAALAPNLMPNMDNMTPYLDIGAAYARHNGVLFAAGKHRKQFTVDLKMGVDWEWTDRLSLRAEYSHRWQDSNISLYDVRRHVFEVGARYDLM